MRSYMQETRTLDSFELVAQFVVGVGVGVDVGTLVLLRGRVAPLRSGLLFGLGGSEDRLIGNVLRVPVLKHIHFLDDESTRSVVSVEALMDVVHTLSLIHI